MGVNTTEFESFEQQFLELIEELETVTSSEHRLRKVLRTESTRADAAEAARDAALRDAAEARSSAAAASASVAYATTALATVQDELNATKMQFDLAERHRVVLEEKCSELSGQLDSLQRDLNKLKSLQCVHSDLQRQYTELQDRVQNATTETRREASRLESELRRVEKSAGGGAEIRERARLAAAAHVHERRLAAAELQHTNQELHNAKAEVTRLSARVAELQCRLAEFVGNDGVSSKSLQTWDPNFDAIAEARAALEAERAGAARLERALAAALSDNATLAAQLHTTDNATAIPPTSSQPISAHSANICAIDAFLAD